MKFKSLAVFDGRHPTTYFAVGICIFIGCLSYFFGPAPVFWWVIWGAFSLVTGAVLVLPCIYSVQENGFETKDLCDLDVSSAGGLKPWNSGLAKSIDTRPIDIDLDQDMVPISSLWAQPKRETAHISAR